MSRTPQPELVLSWLRERAPEMATTLRRFAGMESPSSDPSAQAPAFEFLATELEALSFAVRRIRGREVGDHLYARPRDREYGRPCQLLLGHLDTVWPVGTLEEMPMVRDGDVLRGPGTFDMKGGLVQMLYAFRVLWEFDAELPATPVVFVNADEEIGSPESTRWVRLLARRSTRAFVLEPSFGSEGDLKTGRKGVGHFVVKACGSAAHAGINPEAGVSAVLEISHQIQSLFALNDPERGISVNVGTVDGGLRPNVVAPEASAHVDARVLTEEDAREVEKAIFGLEPAAEGVTLDITGGFSRPPMEPTLRNHVLWEHARAVAERLGFALGETVVGGASDGNTASQLTATLDGLGAVGHGAHAQHEQAIVSKMPERAALLALLLVAPMESGGGSSEPGND